MTHTHFVPTCNIILRCENLLDRLQQLVVRSIGFLIVGCRQATCQNVVVRKKLRAKHGETRSIALGRMARILIFGDDVRGRATVRTAPCTPYSAPSLGGPKEILI